MLVKINQIRVSLDYSDDELLGAVCKKLHLPPDRFEITRFVRRSVDARQRNDKPYFIFSLIADLKDIKKIPARLRGDRDIEVYHEPADVALPQGKINTDKKIVVVGMGPAGLMAALTLTKAGYKPLLIDRGGDVTSRDASVGKFWSEGSLDSDNNVLYGEGGAGLYSDGKLTARSKDRPRMKQFFQTLVDCGCDEDILIDAEPHVGSDVLKRVISNMRKKIINAGGQVKFNARLEKIHIKDGRLTGVTINSEHVPADACFLATGHSARDIYSMLNEAGVNLAAKPFAVGVRVELLQARVDKSQYGKFANHPSLGAASFRLTQKPNDDLRACYSFCTCPGGMVISCASDNDEFTTNGMSLAARDLPYANAAFLVPVTPDDFPSQDPLAGIDFQREIERKAFIAGGADYSIPACSLVDFLKGEGFESIFHSRSCKRAVPADIRSIFPDYITETLKVRIPQMLKKMSVIHHAETLLYAAETRSSSPVRILRDDTGQSENTAGLYPIGEGAGYAGGIVSSALDGIKQAQAFMSGPGA